jgi:hypothetical protein
MDDNIQIKDGLGNEFTLRSKDISARGDGSLQRSLVLATPYPVDYGNGTGAGPFHHTGKSGVMAAGLAAAAPIYAFQNPSAAVFVLLKRVKIAAWSLNAGFASGLATFDLFVARSFTALDTGGQPATLSGNNGKLRTAYASTVSDIVRSTTGALTPGTRTLDNSPIESWNVAVTNGANTPLMPTPYKLFDKAPGEMPLLLAQNEGFVILATVPATGIWTFAIGAEWDEVAVTSY